MRASLTLPLVGPGGEPVDLRRTLRSHGVASLWPLQVGEDGATLTATLAPRRGRPRVVEVSSDGGDGGRGGVATVRIRGRAPAPSVVADLLAAVRHVLRLDEDLSPFYALVVEDPDLAWAAAGAGRMVRAATVFEDVVKTICTTNCAWSATERMVTALVAHLGAPAPGAPAEGPQQRAFPTPRAMAGADEAFYTDVVRAGYRGRYLRELARAVASGELDLEGLADPERDDDEVEAALLALPGVGPYAAAHVMMMLGRYSRLILDSWTRPTYARLLGRDSVTDAEIIDRFAPYGRWAGLAFWLRLTRGWVDDLAAPRGAD